MTIKHRLYVKDIIKDGEVKGVILKGSPEMVKELMNSIENYFDEETYNNKNEQRINSLEYNLKKLENQMTTKPKFRCPHCKAVITEVTYQNK